MPVSQFELKTIIVTVAMREISRRAVDAATHSFSRDGHVQSSRGLGRAKEEKVFKRLIDTPVRLRWCGLEAWPGWSVVVLRIAD